VLLITFFPNDHYVTLRRLPFSSEIQSADLIETDTACPSRLHHHHAAFTTHDRWPGWSTANIPGCACLMASYRHFALAALAKCYQPKIALPRPLTIHFPHCDLEASGGLYPLERMRMGSSGLVAFLLKRLCWQQPARASSYHHVLKLGSGIARRVYCRQANSEVEAAFLFDFENNSVDRGCQHSLFLQQMSEGDRARLLTAGVCRNILTQWHFDPNDEAIPDYDVFPPPVVAELADGFMRNLFENFSEGKLYSLGPKWQRFWQRGIRLMTQIRPLALETFVRTSFIVRLCDVILSEFLAMSRINCYEFRPKFYAVHGSSFPELCYMLSDILQLDASLVMPCALQLREILHPHWQHIPDSPRFGFRSLTFRSALEAVGCSPSAACSYSLTATHLLPFPIDQDAFRRRLNGLEHVEKIRARQFELAAADDSQCYNCRSFENAPQKKARFDAPVFMYFPPHARTYASKV
jgi:hypothetical protein